MDKALLKDIVLEQRKIQESLDPGIKRESLSSIEKYFSLPHSIVISGIRRSVK
jgi:hypothetical protein